MSGLASAAAEPAASDSGPGGSSAEFRSDGSGAPQGGPDAGGGKRKGGMRSKHSAPELIVTGKRRTRTKGAAWASLIHSAAVSVRAGPCARLLLGCKSRTLPRMCRACRLPH